jgi:hypothetical protein
MSKSNLVLLRKISGKADAPVKVLSFKILAFLKENPPPPLTPPVQLNFFTSFYHQPLISAILLCTCSILKVMFYFIALW